MPELIKKMLIGTSICAGLSVVSNAPGFAATLSEIPLSAVSAEFGGPPLSFDPLTLDFQVNVSNTQPLEPNLRLTSFTVILVDQLSELPFSLNGQPASGWQVNGGTFQVLSPEDGIAPGASLDGFSATTEASDPTFLRSRLEITSISSTAVAVPEPSSTVLNTLALGAFLGTGLVLKRKMKKEKSASRDTSCV
jgi:hypothetical protein